MNKKIKIFSIIFIILGVFVFFYPKIIGTTGGNCPYSDCDKFYHNCFGFKIYIGAGALADYSDNVYCLGIPYGDEAPYNQ
ncbi:MAG: hypothetical protein L6Q29_02260 [Candidatus Pacebacteria bacterium]|nr:hypothetical protein [Candidatus Paceibacterota bacterium]NUQ57005.1 hypothetical protein [Candidatus Paceibacter sp.]